MPWRRRAEHVLAELFQKIAERAKDETPPPLPAPSHLELHLHPHGVAGDPDLVALLRQETCRRKRATGELTALAAACALATPDETWRMLVNGDPRVPVIEAAINSPDVQDIAVDDTPRWAEVTPALPAVVQHAVPLPINEPQPWAQRASAPASTRGRALVLILKTAAVGLAVTMSLFLFLVVKNKRDAARLTKLHLAQGESLRQQFATQQWDAGFRQMQSFDDPALSKLGGSSIEAFKSPDLARISKLPEDWKSAAERAENEPLRQALNQGAGYWKTQQLVLETKRELARKEELRVKQRAALKGFFDRQQWREGFTAMQSLDFPLGDLGRQSVAAVDSQDITQIATMYRDWQNASGATWNQDVREALDQGTDYWRGQLFLGLIRFVPRLE